jgi:hypothetical protein
VHPTTPHSDKRTLEASRAISLSFLHFFQLVDLRRMSRETTLSLAEHIDDQLFVARREKSIFCLAMSTEREWRAMALTARDKMLDAEQARGCRDIVTRLFTEVYSPTPDQE